MSLKNMKENFKEEASLTGKFYRRPLFYINKIDKIVYAAFFIFIVGYFLIDFTFNSFDIDGFTKASFSIAYLAVGYFVLSKIVDIYSHKNKEDSTK